MRKIVLTAGERFGRLTVVREVDGLASAGENKRQFLCHCDCGNEKVVRLDLMRSGRAQTCGCRQRMKHGDTGSYTYSSWANIKDRCRNPRSPDYLRYGGRGIAICERWLDFSKFLADMGERPSGTTIDRIDSEGDYEPENCRWATKKQQGRNRRNNRMLTHNGDTLCLSEWAKRLGVAVNVIRWRLASGWTVAESLTTPSGRNRHVS